MATRYLQKPINRFKLGLSTAFGAGLKEDEDGNKIYDIVEVLGFDGESVPSGLDYGYYGRVKVTDRAEDEFIAVPGNVDNSGNPIFINNWRYNPLFTMKRFVQDEICHICRGTTSENPTEIYLKNSPIIKDYNGEFDDEIQSFSVVDMNGDRVNKTVLYTWNDYDPLLDRIGNLATSTVLVSIVDHAGSPTVLVPGESIKVSYWVFIHTDNLRDGNNYTSWATLDGDVDNYLIIDMNPFGTKSTLVYNNIEIIFDKIQYPVGPYEYILQGASLQATGRERYKTIANGLFPAKVSNQSFVIKFDRVDYRYLKLILIGAAKDNFMSVSAYIGNSRAIATGSAIPLDIDLSLHNECRIKVDSNDYYDIDLSKHNIIPLNQVDVNEARGLINLLYHEQYLLDHFSCDFGYLTSDTLPISGALTFADDIPVDLGIQYNSAGIDFFVPYSCDSLLIRDTALYNTCELFSGFDVYGSMDNSAYDLLPSGQISAYYNNGLGTDILFEDIGGYHRYYKVNRSLPSLQGFENDVSLIISPDVAYSRIVSPDHSANNMFSLSSPIDGSGSIVGFENTGTADCSYILFNNTIGSTSYVSEVIYGTENDVANTFEQTEFSGQLEASDFYLMNVLPYYADERFINTTVYRGEQLAISDYDTNGIAIAYIPSEDNSGFPEREAYRLVYYDVRYGTQMAYQGIPANTSFTFKRNIAVSIRSTTTTRNTLEQNGSYVQSPLSIDVLKTTPAAGGDVLYLKFKGAADYDIFAVQIDAPATRTLLSEGIDYYINIDTKKVTLRNDFHLDYSYHSIEAEYDYPIFKDNFKNHAPLSTIHLLNSKYNEKKLSLSGIRVYPEQYFKDYIVNDQDSVMEFEINPETWEETFEDGGAIAKLLDGGLRKDVLSSKSRFTAKMTAPKISREMRDQIRYWIEHSEVLGLVDDMKRLYVGFLTPNSFSATRRKTSASEQDGETSSYSYNIEFKEN